MKTSTTYPRIAADGKFAVNVLAHDQHAVSNQFARKGTDKWAGIDWSPAASGNPIIADTLMWVDCEIWAEHEAGDHHLEPAGVAMHGHGAHRVVDLEAALHPVVQFVDAHDPESSDQKSLQRVIKVIACGGGDDAGQSTAEGPVGVAF